MTAILEKVNGSAVTDEPRPADPRAEAEAEAIRVKAAADTVRAEAEAEALRIEAQGKAEAERIKAEAEAEKQRIANERAEMRLEKERADHAVRLAEAERRRKAAERAAAQEEADAQAAQQAETETAQKGQRTSRVWFWCALGFAIACAVVALPVQMAAFYNPDAKWLLAAPLMLEGAAWVVLMGAASAVAAGRPHWHYRLIAWALAFVAAGINLSHGLSAFDPATAIGTAFASLAGPGVWDLHEHGRIRKRDGKLTWRQRREQKKTAENEAAEKTAAEAQKVAEKEAEKKADEEAAKQLAETRKAHFPKVWAHAEKLAAALGETSVTETVWRRAHRDIEGADPAESVDVIRARNVAERRVLAARSEAPGSTPIKVTNTQRVPHLPPASGRGSKTGPKVRGVRRSGDSPAFVAGARRQAAETARKAASRGADDTFREEAER